MDGGSENRGIIEELIRRYNIKLVRGSAYHPQSNGLVERGYVPIVNVLAKLCQGWEHNWPDHLNAVLWVDRVTVYQSTRYTPY